MTKTLFVEMTNIFVELKGYESKEIKCRVDENGEKYCDLVYYGGNRCELEHTAFNHKLFARGLI